MSVVKTGIALITTGLKISSAVNQIINGASRGVIPDLSKTSNTQGNNVRGFPNSLEQFASYTPLWTLAALEARQFNDPSSYRNSPADLKHIVFSSAGRYDGQRVETAYGKPEYYINNFVMTTQVSASQKTGNSNAIKFTFDVYEPYSMGLFLQSLQLAALNARQPNYLQCPYVLRLDFLGYTDDGKLFSGIKPKYFTIKFLKVTFETNETGSTYKCEAIPFNHQGFSTTINRTYNDIAIVGERNKPLTVKHLLVEGNESLCAVLNRAEQDLVLDEKILIPDEYEVQFPTNPYELFNVVGVAGNNSATVDPNAPEARRAGAPKSTDNNYGDGPIGLAEMGITTGDGGNFPFKREGDTRDEKTGQIKRNQMTIDPKNRKFQFQQNQSLTAIIAQIVLSSDYATKALETKPDPTGFINWFKIDVQIQLKEFDDKRGDFAKKIIYRVVPFKVHQSLFGNPTSAPPGYPELEKLIAKRYDYIYSGSNNDLLKFDLQINNLFYTGTNPKAEKDSGTNTNVDQKSIEEKSGKETQNNTGPAGGSAVAANTGGRVIRKDPGLLNVPGSPDGNETTERLVAKAFQKAFLDNSGDLINITIEILGDPYWMVESGMGNYFSPPSAENPLTTQDGSMNYEGSDVYVYLSLRTPTDINERTGLYDFPDSGKESPFSGIYKVIMCENLFNDAVFRQRLKMIRMPLQAADFDNTRQPVDVNSAAAITVKQEAPRKTTVTDDATSGYSNLF